MIKKVFEDKELVIINKPPGLVVNRADSVKRETLQDWMEKEYAQVFEGVGNTVEDMLFKQRSGMVHRLDKDTSGALILSKNPGSMLAMMGKFKKREVQKTYVALVHGRLAPETGDINLPIERSKMNRHKFEVGLGGKQSETHYKVEKFMKMTGRMAQKYQDGFSLVEIKPVTGRTHQIRVHMTHIHHALVSDEVYGGRKRVKLDKSWCGRHFLHARSLLFKHPISEKMISVDARLSPDLQSAMNKLSLDE